MRGILAFPIRIPQHLHYGVRITIWSVSIADSVKFDTLESWFQGNAPGNARAGQACVVM
jgi:hypothetical protein